MSSVVFACHSAACRPPTAGGTGGSRNTGGVYKAERGWAIKAANGVELRAVFSRVNPPFDADPRSTIDDIWDSVAHQALIGLKKAYDMAPVDMVPTIVIGDYTKNPNFLSQTKSEARADSTMGLVYPQHTEGNPIGVGQIGINASEGMHAAIMNDYFPKIFMRQGKDKPLVEYVTTHEYGHHRFFNGPDRQGPWRSAQLFEKYRNQPDQISPYGTTNKLEAHAEVFAAWVAEGGGTGKSAITRDYQDEFGWGESDAATFALDESVPIEDQIVGVFDTFEGPAYVLRDGSRVTLDL